MIKVSDVIDVMETWAPSSLAETWDNVGLITGDPEKTISSVMITLDVTEEIICKAIDTKISLIITHHPPIFKPLKTLTGSTHSSRIVRDAVRKDIAIYAAHTNLDQTPGGVSTALAQKLGLDSISILSPGSTGMIKFVTYTPPEYTDRIREAAGSAGAGTIGEYKLCSFTSRGTGTYIPSPHAVPFEGEAGKLSRVDEDRLEMVVPSPLVPSLVEAARKAHPYDEMAYELIPLSNSESLFGYGAVGTLKEPMKPSDFIEYASETLGVSSVRTTQVRKDIVHRVAVMGGNGSDFIGQAVARGADAYVTGDLGYHDFIDFDRSILLIDASHQATEFPVLDTIRERLLSSDWGTTIDIFIERGERTPNIFEYTIL